MFWSDRLLRGERVGKRGEERRREGEREGERVREWRGLAQKED